MKLLSVNVSRPTEVTDRGRTVMTGIFKQPVTGRIALGRTNLEGDGQADLSVHGGPHMAVYAYPVEHYDFWRREPGREDLPFGTFGENFTVRGMLEEEVCIGDVFRVGSARLQVSQPRLPCFKLGIKIGSPDFPKRFLKSERSGFYFRVLEEGDVGAGDTIARVDADPARLSVRAVHHLKSFDRENVETARRALAVQALSPAWREMIGGILNKAGPD
ncbi:MAG: MOSC domain-containing protein [Myxococcota bacterium]